MVTNKQGEAAVGEIERWANQIAQATEREVAASAYYDADSSTYVLRLSKGSRVLLFRLSEAQVQTPAREQECERVVERKIKNLVA